MQYHILIVSLRYVLDSDVVVAGFRSSKGASRQLLMAALDGSFGLLLSVPLILEYEAVLTRPEHLQASGLSVVAVRSVLDVLASTANQVTLAFRWRPALRDPDDDMVLETAINGAADAIVTFNIRDFEGAAKMFNCAVLLPRQALQNLRSLGHEKK